MVCCLQVNAGPAGPNSVKLLVTKPAGFRRLERKMSRPHLLGKQTVLHGRQWGFQRPQRANSALDLRAAATQAVWGRAGAEEPTGVTTPLRQPGGPVLLRQLAVEAPDIAQICF